MGRLRKGVQAQECAGPQAATSPHRSKDRRKVRAAGARNPGGGGEREVRWEGQEGPRRELHLLPLSSAQPTSKGDSKFSVSLGGTHTWKQRNAVL